MILLILALTLGSIVFWLWWKRETNENEPPEYVFNLKWSKIHNVINDGSRLWNRTKNMSAECLKRDGVMKMSIGPRTIYVITDPDDFLTVSNACLEKDPFYNFCRNWLGNGLITAPTSKWKVHRKLLNPLFSHRSVDSLMTVFNNISRQLVTNLEVEVGNGPFDHCSYTRSNALDTICMTALGAKFMENTEVKNKYIHLTENLMKIYVFRLKNFFFHYNIFYSLSSLKREEVKCTETVCSITSTILDQIKESSKNENECSNTKENEPQGLKFKPFIKVLLDLFSNSDAFTDSDIRQHVDTFVVAGEDTTAGVSMFCLLLVGSYPQVQEKIYEEIMEIFGDEDRDILKEDLSKLVYLEAVLKETMRIYPIVPTIARHLDKDVKLRNCTLSKGRSVILSIYGIHRHPMWGPDADEFKPERWLAPLSNYQKMFAGFSMGRRICIGKAYAMASLKVIMVHVFRNYIIHGDHTKCKFWLDITLKPVSGHHITIERRNNKKQIAGS